MRRETWLTEGIDLPGNEQIIIRGQSEKQLLGRLYAVRDAADKAIERTKTQLEAEGWTPD